MVPDDREAVSSRKPSDRGQRIGILIETARTPDRAFEQRLVAYTGRPACRSDGLEMDAPDHGEYTTGYIDLRICLLQLPSRMAAGPGSCCPVR